VARPSLLVVSPPALDLVSGRARPGGPGLYAGAAWAMEGGRAAAVGPAGYCTLETVRAEERLGAPRLGYVVAGPGHVNRLVYTATGRQVEIIHPAPALDPQEVAGSLAGGWDAVLLSPLAGEDPGVARLLEGGARLVAVDVQGYARVGLEPWSLYGRLLVVHAGDGEPWRPGAGRVVVVTRGPGPVDVYVDGSLAGRVYPEGGVVDPTGAGDVFTSLFLLGFLEEGDPVGAARRAVEGVPGALASIHERLPAFDPEHCG